MSAWPDDYSPQVETEREMYEHLQNLGVTNWTVHVEGPDDLKFFDTEVEARAYAAGLNEWWANEPKTEFSAVINAVVYAPPAAPEGAPE